MVADRYAVQWWKNTVLNRKPDYPINHIVQFLYSFGSLLVSRGAVAEPFSKITILYDDYKWESFLGSRGEKMLISFE